MGMLHYVQMIRQSQLRTFIVSTLTLAVLLFLSPTPSFATNLPNVQITKVQGMVTGPDGQPFKFARVYGTCDGKTTRGITNGQGKYQLHFVGNNVCGAGAVVNVTVEKDGQSTSGNGVVVLKKDGKYVDVNLTLMNMSFNVPEYDYLTGFAALLISVGGFYYFRRRQLAKAYI